MADLQDDLPVVGCAQCPRKGNCMPHEKSRKDLASVRDDAEKRLEQEIEKDGSLEGIRGVQIPLQLQEFTKGHVYLRDHTCQNMLWAKPLECWFAAYRNAFPESSENWPEEEELNAMVFDEDTARLNRYCLESNAYGVHVSLSDLVRQKYKESDVKMERHRREVRERILVPMDRFDLWRCFLTHEGRRGGSAVRLHTNPQAVLERGVRYDIRAGEVLWGFFEYLLVPLRDKQVEVMLKLLDRFR